MPENQASLLVSCIVLFTFTFFYDLWVGKLEENAHDSGYTAFLVIGGTLVVLAVATVRYIVAGNVAGINAIVDLLFQFAAAGFWMTIGSVQRHSRSGHSGRHTTGQSRTVTVKPDELARQLVPLVQSFGSTIHSVAELTSEINKIVSNGK